MVVSSKAQHHQRSTYTCYMSLKGKPTPTDLDHFFTFPNHYQQQVCLCFWGAFFGFLEKNCKKKSPQTAKIGQIYDILKLMTNLSPIFPISLYLLIQAGELCIVVGAGVLDRRFDELVEKEDCRCDRRDQQSQ